LKILIDGRTLAHTSTTGIQRHAQEIITALKEADISIPRYKNRYYQQLWEHTLLPFYARKYDLLFCPSNVAPYWHFKKTKLVVTVHDLAFIDFPAEYSSFFQKYYTHLIPWVIKKADRVLTISAFSKERIEKEYPLAIGKVNVIHHGISDKFTPQGALKENFVLYVGAVNEIKNFQGVLEVFMQESFNKVPLKMILASSSSFKQSAKVEKILADVAHHNNIEIIDFVDQEDLKVYYQKAKVFLFPSFHESFGFPPLEAMACGTPVIVSNVTALPEVCGDAALYVDPNDKEDITNKLLQLYHDDVLQEVMIAKGVQRAGVFTWDKSAEEHIKIFEEVLRV